jgi:hypothetical protein
VTTAAPCKHERPEPDTCRWCDVAARDRRYADLWWGAEEPVLKHKFVLRFRRGFALGDAVLGTALVRDIHAAYPGEYVTMIDSVFSPVWWNNPLAAKVEPGEHQVIDLSYVQGIVASKAGNQFHFLSWLHKDFEAKTGVKVPVTKPKGDLRLTHEEDRPLVSGRYWVIMAGGKLDMTTKHWGRPRWQRMVDALLPEGFRFVQVGAVHYHHVHAPLAGVFDAVGHTENCRDLFSLVKYSEGVICGITSAMHVAAAFDKPCVVIAGGREEPWWEAYVNNFYPYSFGDRCERVKVEHKYLHTVGLLPCCQSRGCWRAKTVQDGRTQQAVLCELPVRRDGEDPVPTCLDMVTPEHAAEAVRSYYRDGTLAPLGGDRPLVSPGGLAPVAEGQRWLRSTMEPHKTQRPEQKQMPHEPGAPAVVRSGRLLDHAFLGGRVTVFVLCYGDHAYLARRCIDSIRKTVPAQALDLRVGLNAVCPDTRAYVLEQEATKVYDHEANDLKYPLMREMFHDPEHPITSNYVVWFDDDSYVVSPAWLQRLCESVIANHPQGGRLYGITFVHDFARYQRAGHRPDLWFRQAPWYRGLDFLSGRQARYASPNGAAVRFVSGGFWAVASDVIAAAGIPDERLRLNGGDIVIGEQVRQAGYKIVHFNGNKELVHSSGHAPRGESKIGSAKIFPWQG